jgi:hypothetical protein
MPSVTGGGPTRRKVAGQWRYVYRAIDQFGQVIDVFVSPRRDAAAARRLFERALADEGEAVSARDPLHWTGPPADVRPVFEVVLPLKPLALVHRLHSSDRDRLAFREKV